MPDYDRDDSLFLSDEVIKRHLCSVPLKQYAVFGGSVSFVFFGQIMQHPTPALLTLPICYKCSCMVEQGG
ncbi:hypothetical protein TNCV_1071621 [Trichonephila clavipes]|nr:hypothetical protein TNCV_1071621 [Trichonephila clavipes]